MGEKGQQYIGDQFKLWTPPNRYIFSVNTPLSLVTKGLVWWTEQARVTGDVQNGMSGTVRIVKDARRDLFVLLDLHLPELIYVH